ncbi:ribonuclease domain-containing protein [Amycolatopsis anabasis]|uniref:ribonuclease domain-containing protein n=1 Tax=Amycolatopsis anabasis TaxID=1840409 RepID=UPI00131DCDF4|nr:ribonuclease domain-containing protein [Amycolatopsis anabasis]
MTNYKPRIASVLLALLVAFLGGAAAPAVAHEAAAPITAAAECGDTSGFKKTPLDTLPKEATDTYNLIKKGGPFPFPEKDGTVFSNREGILPSCASGYYHEYTVITPGSPDRGARRIVTGSGGEFFYTADHYKTFSVIPVDGGTPSPECGDPAGLDTVKLSTLSAEAKAAVDKARGGASGTVYENREGVLPACDSGYYQLFPVGAEDRVISGKGGEIFYTPDHYSTFQFVELDS